MKQRRRIVALGVASMDIHVKHEFDGKSLFGPSSDSSEARLATLPYCDTASCFRRASRGLDFGDRCPFWAHVVD